MIYSRRRRKCRDSAKEKENISIASKTVEKKHTHFQGIALHMQFLQCIVYS